MVRQPRLDSANPSFPGYIIVWFTENPWPPMLIAGILCLIFLAVWRSNQRFLYLALGLLFAAACGGIYFVERAIVTEGERLQQRVVQLCDDFRAKKPAVLDYVSATRPDLKLVFAGALGTVTVHDDLRLTDFQTQVTNQNSRGTVHFRANATIDVAGFGNVGFQPARLILTFQREQGEWKIIEVQRLNPINGNRMEIMEKSSG